MKNADTPAFPCEAVERSTSLDPREPNQVVFYPGMTKREHFALELYAALVVADATRSAWLPHEYLARDKTELADLAIQHADALLARLFLEDS